MEAKRWMRLAVATLLLGSGGAGAVVLDPQEQLGRQTFWDNRDFAWYAEEIPLFESPDAELDTTYYYRWDLMTKHLVYGSPEHGYAFTEFIDRPFWSGTYGAISCPSGLQLYDLRWFRKPRFARDYTRYWFRTPGAEPHRYSCWLADSAWAAHTVHPDDDFIVDLYPDLTACFAEWKRLRWDAEQEMFWQIGHDDGMETNINSRQTQDAFRGAPGYRPTLNSYLFADARALARIARLAGKTEEAEAFDAAADRLRVLVQSRLWDPERTFFFPLSRQAEEKDGFRVEPLTWTHRSGQFAGSPHGRELIGYVPWQFGLPEKGKGFEEAWKFLMDPAYFFAARGPATVERNDPLFFISPACCVWSGNSWPYATTQTLVALANVLHDYEQEWITPEDYFRLLRIYALTHRKDGEPYLAEACDPDTGSWEGHDSFNHSEHYFHSGFIDLVISGLVGLRPGESDVLTVRPLAPRHWDYFALDRLRFRGREIAVFWDRDGKRYGRGAGLQVWADGLLLARADDLEAVTCRLAAVEERESAGERRFNYAVNNSSDYFPRVLASHTHPETPGHQVNDGQYWYLQSPPNRWTPVGSGQAEDWCGVDFGIERPVDEARLYLLDDGPGSRIRPPADLWLEAWRDGAWESIPGQATQTEPIAGRVAHSVRFPEIRTRKLRAVLRHPAEAVAGLSEFEAWGAGSLPLDPPTAAPDNLAFNGRGEGFPKASASHTSRFDRVEEAHDGKIQYGARSRNRWTAYESPRAEDWLEIDFGRETACDAVDLHFFDDGGGVQAPEHYRIEYWSEGAWREVEEGARDPERPAGGVSNGVRFRQVQTTKLRVVFRHRGASRAGLTEIEIRNESR
ncbi:MAG TPA: discoidin domain-containing protein [Verrucomicrobiales bacterium]|nr:discoidin domain-containing protein [Verrucomicrobiales bacterium]